MLDNAVGSQTSQDGLAGGSFGEPFYEKTYLVAASLQRLAGEAYFGSRESLEDAYRALAKELPSSLDMLESLWLREKLVNTCTRAASVFHRTQGCEDHGCDMPRLEALSPLWNTPHNPRAALVRWVVTFFRQYDRFHWRVGLPVRTATVLRRSWRVHRRMEDVAARLASSRSTMEELFKERYGLSPHAYHTRVRIREAVLHLHKSDDKVEYIAKRAGYAGVGNFYLALEKCVGLTPTAVRELDWPIVQSLLEERLETDIAKLYEQSRQICVAQDDGRASD